MDLGNWPINLGKTEQPKIIRKFNLGADSYNCFNNSKLDCVLVTILTYS